MRIITLAGYLLLASLLPLSAIGDEVKLAEDAPAMYLVKEGDTLWAISNLFLRDPWMWPDIWDVNPQLDNPHLIFPGDQLYLVYVDGQPRLRVRRGQQSRTVKLTPQMRVDPLDSAIPVIPLEDIGAWLAQNRIVEPPVLDAAPYVIAGDKRHLLSSAGDRLYARGQFPEEETGFGIYRGGDVYVDPITQEVLGYEAQDIGSARLVAHHEQEISLLEVTRITEEVRNGDRLLPNESRRIAANFQPHASEEELNGLMIAVDSGVSQIGTLAIVVINKGARENVSIGQVMAIYQTGEVVRDEIRQENVQVPDSRAGLLMVFRVYEKMSYGIVLKSSRPLAVMDRVGNP
jgi:hypothetical protein